MKDTVITIGIVTVIILFMFSVWFVCNADIPNWLKIVILFK